MFHVKHFFLYRKLFSCQAKNKSKNRENNRKNYFHFYMDLLEMKVL